MRTIAAGAALLLVACGSPSTEVAQPVKARKVVENAEEFQDGTQREIAEAEAAVREAERVIAEAQAQAERERQAAKARAARSATTARSAPRTAPAAPNVSGDTFDRLARCESGMRQDAVGGGGRYFSYFQWSLSTWRAASGGMGDPRGVDYATQKAIAMRWAERSNPASQWPVCWPRAVRG